MKSTNVKLLAAFVISLTAGLLCIYYSHTVSSSQPVVDKISSRLAREINIAEREAKIFLHALASDSIASLSTKSSHAFFLFKKEEVTFWTDHTFVPTYASVADTFNLKLLKGGNSDYLARKWIVSKQFFLICLVPLSRKYTITNDYLKPEWNTEIFPTGDISILEPGAPNGTMVCIKDQCPFKINFQHESFVTHERTQLAAVIFIFIALVLLAVFMLRLAAKFRYPELSFIFLYAVFLVVRIVMVKLNFPTDIIPSAIFNPQVFAQSTLNASLGDLLLNELVVLLLCFFIFKNYFRFKSFIWLIHHKVFSWGLSVLAGLCVFFAALFPFVVIQTLYNNSSIVLDISQSITFDILRILALLAVVISGLCSFLFAHPFIRILIADRRPMRVLISFMISMVLFAVINELTQQEYLSSLVVGACYFLIVYFLKLYTSLNRLGFATFAYLFVAVFFLSANSAYGFQLFSRKEKIENQFRFAAKFLIDRDNFGEYLLAETARDVTSDIFIQTRISSPFLNRDVVRQKIRQVFLPGYFNKYDVDIFLFNSGGEPIDNRSSSNFPTLIKEFNHDAYRTEYEGIYFVNNPLRDVAQQYRVVMPIVRHASISGYVLLELSLKKIIPESVYPELLVDNSAQQFYNAQNLSYAMYANNKILFSAGAFNYENEFNKAWLGKTDIHTTGIHVNGNDHIAVEDENARIAVVTSQRLTWEFVLANFSFMMVLGLVIILIFIMMQGVANYIQGDKLYFSARIQLLLNLSFFVPLIIVSIVALQLINRSSQNQLNDEYLSKAKTVGEHVAAQLSEVLEERYEDAGSFENRVTDLAKLANVDVNIYNPKGFLIATSQPLIFENDLLSRYLQPQALHLVRNGESLFIETEQVGRLKYFVSYAALKSPVTGNLVGILGIPFFRSGVSLEKVQISILANILNIFTLILIALIVLAYFVSKWLTFPLKFITQSLRKTSLTKINQPLVWKSDDEIGLMVKEYNQMLYNLSESKAELEQSQREKTWREIAQQVAHEIKNPLTPMKLMLQQLERSLQAGTNSSDKTGKAISSLLTQIDTLNDIASSFSSFAKMPELFMQQLELVSLMRRLVDLHSHEGNIHFKVAYKELFIQGDEQLLGRTFSNIILNAFQAERSGEALRVTISLHKNDRGVLISFRDNGKGIDKVVADRIFYPHFTTKRSGSGLGLAIAKQAIEQMNGRIWFETEVGSGTTFFIELFSADTR